MRHVPSYASKSSFQRTSRSPRGSHEFHSSHAEPLEERLVVVEDSSRKADENITRMQARLRQLESSTAKAMDYANRAHERSQAALQQLHTHQVVGHEHEKSEVEMMRDIHTSVRQELDEVMASSINEIVRKDLDAFFASSKFEDEFFRAFGPRIQEWIDVHIEEWAEAHLGDAVQKDSTHHLNAVADSSSPGPNSPACSHELDQPKQDVTFGSPVLSLRECVLLAGRKCALRGKGAQAQAHPGSFFASVPSSVGGSLKLDDVVRGGIECEASAIEKNLRESVHEYVASQLEHLEDKLQKHLGSQVQSRVDEQLQRALQSAVASPRCTGASCTASPQSSTCGTRPDITHRPLFRPLSPAKLDRRMPGESSFKAAESPRRRVIV